MRKSRTPLALIACLPIFLASVSLAQDYKRLPPDGQTIDPTIRETLETRVEKLQHKINALAEASKDAESWQPDVEVLVRAVRLALVQKLFFKQSETAIATSLLDETERRLQAVKHGDRNLILLGLQKNQEDKTQLLVGGFRSQIDDSIQPYGLVIPIGFQGSNTPYRVDVWLHGRGDTKTEIPFIHERMTKVGRYSPESTIVLHPFGRHCNAFKFAGETDVYEALAHLGELVSIDKRQVSIRGFSMGGAGCWHFAVHDPGRWFAANPGAGFVDTIVYQGWTQQTPYPINTIRQKLMNWYDVLPWVSNLANTRTIPYSGEKDKQKQAADRVVAKTEKLGIEVPYVVGKNMGHKIDAESALTIEAKMDTWAKDPELSPRKTIDFTTYTLHYNTIDWIKISGLESHWSPSRIQAEIGNDGSIHVKTNGITRFEVDFCDSGWPETDQRVEVLLDGQTFQIDDWDEAPGVQCEFEKQKSWRVVEQIDSTLRKRPGLQGPIDDAFCSRFLFVAPSRPAQHGTAQRWIDREFEYAKQRWSRLMRGKVNVVLDTQITEEQIRDCHLICFGDYSSNQYLQSISDRLPIQWTRNTLQVGSRTFQPDKHVAAFCFPNPRNPNRYVVVNSGMTFREFSNISNSRQIPMLADWTVLSVEPSDDGIFPGEIAAEGFFDESWSLAK